MVNHCWRMTKSIWLALVILAMGLGSLSCQRGYSGPIESITIGSAPLESSALVYIAEARDFFTKNRVKVTVKPYETGAAAHTALLNGEVDVAIPAEYPLVGSAFRKDRVSLIASIDEAQYFFFVGRKDRGVENIAGLRGKKIGVVQKTIAEFYLGRFLVLNGIGKNQVSLVNMNYQGSEDAIVNGSVDAIVTRPPYLQAVTEKLGANAVVWPVQSSQALYAILTARNDWINEHHDSLARILKSLAAAEEYVIRYPGEAKSIVQKKLNFDDAYMSAAWEQNQFILSLDLSLVLAMEDEARWMISNNLTTEKSVPDFLDYIYEDTLKSTKPGVVNIIR